MMSVEQVDSFGAGRGTVIGEAAADGEDVTPRSWSLTCDGAAVVFQREIELSC